ncbi:MAG: thymidine phosphorylase [Minwuiales bacterium]|nr:thymidine phosphorylase [Minwuiales bacterium]
MADFLPQEIIRRKRDGHRLDVDEVRFMVGGITDGSISDTQVAAFAMAVFLRGMQRDESVALTRAMPESGATLDWSAEALPGPVLDKHSTGGIGDKVSQILAPIISACGGFCPMISGRGLGHTGGTLDKLEAIPGYCVDPGTDLFRQTVKESGCAIIGQTQDLAPADRRLYAIRDVTATVESIPLITASILSKKLAAGLDALVMDVKFGSGAFAATSEMASDLAESLVSVANGAGLPTAALLTDMNQVLGDTAGNAVEVAEAIAFLTGRRREPRLYEVTKALAAELLVLGGMMDAAAAPMAVDGALDSGTAAERFAQMVASLGGPTDLLEAPDRYLEIAPVRRAVIAPRRGFVTGIDTRRVGLAVLTLGGGRRLATDKVDHGVGLTAVQGPGFRTAPNRPLAVIHARSEADADTAEAALLAAYSLGDGEPRLTPPVRSLLRV